MKLNLRTKLLGALAVMILMIVVIGSVNMCLSNRSQNLLHSIMERDAKSVEMITDLLRRTSFVHSNCLLHLFHRSVDGMDRYESEIIDWVDKINRNFETLRERIEDQAILDKLGAAETSWKTYLKVWNEQVKPLSRANRDEDAFALVRKRGSAGAAIRNATYNLNELYDAIFERVGYQVELAEQDFKKNQLILIAIILVAIIFGLIFGIRFGTRIAGSVNTVARAAKRVAAGDLDQKVEVKTGDEIGSMADSFNIMTVRLKELMEAEQKASEEMRKEIAGRKQVQEELKALNETLEGRVAERTQDLRHSNEMLMAAGERLEHLLISSPAVIYSCECSGDYGATFISKNIKEQFGYEPQEFVNDPKFWANHIHPEDREWVFAGLSQLSEKGLHTHEYRFQHNDGTYRWMRDELRLVLDDEGNPVEFVGCWIDVTERKTAEEELRESEKRFRTVADFNYDWESWVGPDGKYIYVSPSCERITGYSAEEFMKDPGLFTRIVHPDDRESVSVHVRGHLNVGGTGDHHIDFRITTREDDIRWISHYCQPVYDKDGNWLGIRASNRDITDRIKLAEQLAQAQKMEGIGRLAGGVAHDFNNLLMSIMGHADLALMSLAEDDPLRRRLEEIKGGGKRAASLTRQLLAFSRKQILQPVVLDLNSLITGFVKMLERLIGEDVELETVLVSGLRLLEADPGQMEQIIMNLVINARDAMPGGGKLIIETVNVDLNEAYAKEHDVSLQPGPYVMLGVSDTGMGMDKKTKSLIFEPFFTTKEVGKGTGLGLSTVYGIVKQSGGYIWVYSEPGHGTTFKIYLPAVEGEAVSKEEKETSPERLTGSETILIVEDDDKVRSLACEILEPQGYRILEAKNGIEALRVSESHKGQIHLMLTDVVMPKMGGRELEEHLRPLRPDMKVIYMSGYTDNAILHHGVLSPEIEFLQKPISSEALKRKVREVLDQ